MSVIGITIEITLSRDYIVLGDFYIHLFLTRYSYALGHLWHRCVVRLSVRPFVRDVLWLNDKSNVKYKFI